MTHQAIDLQHKLTLFNDHWSPRTVAEYNGHDVMVVKVQGEFTWHSHADTDDFFLVLKGELQIDLQTGPHESTVTLGPGFTFRPTVTVEVKIALNAAQMADYVRYVESLRMPQEPHSPP